VISVVCVYNNKRILNDFLLKSLRNQIVDYELILLDNTQEKFKSAAEALNYGGKKAKGKYIMFVHQDVDLSSDSWLEEVEKTVDSIQNLGVAGVAGRKDKKGVMTVIKHGNPSVHAGSITIKKPEEVQTLDECLIIVPKSVFQVLQFDEKVCDDWHLYAVDYCLSVAGRLGYGIFVLPMYIYHLSRGFVSKSKFKKILDLGSLPKSYYSTLRKLLRKHRKYFKKVYTTCGIWNTARPLVLARVLELIKVAIIKMKNSFKGSTQNEF